MKAGGSLKLLHLSKLARGLVPGLGALLGSDDVSVEARAVFTGRGFDGGLLGPLHRGGGLFGAFQGGLSGGGLVGALQGGGRSFDRIVLTRGKSGSVGVPGSLVPVAGWSMSPALLAPVNDLRPPDGSSGGGGRAVYVRTGERLNTGSDLRPPPLIARLRGFGTLDSFSRTGLLGRLDWSERAGLFPDWVEKRKKDQRLPGEQRSGERKLADSERRRILLWDESVSARKPPKERRPRCAREGRSFRSTSSECIRGGTVSRPSEALCDSEAACVSDARKLSMLARCSSVTASRPFCVHSSIRSGSLVARAAARVRACSCVPGGAFLTLLGRSRGATPWLAPGCVKRPQERLFCKR